MKVTSLLLRQRLVAKFTLVAAAACAALVASSGAAVAGMHAVAGARSAVSGGTRGTAQQVPGLAALNKNGDAGITSVSCASPGSCSAVGSYGPDSDPRAFAVSETNGAWGKAERIAGLRNSTFQDPLSVSCGSPGNCSAGGEAGAPVAGDFSWTR